MGPLRARQGYILLPHHGALPLGELVSGAEKVSCGAVVWARVAPSLTTALNYLLDMN